MFRDTHYMRRRIRGKQCPYLTSSLSSSLYSEDVVSLSAPRRRGTARVAPARLGNGEVPEACGGMRHAVRGPGSQVPVQRQSQGKGGAGHLAFSNPMRRGTVTLGVSQCVCVWVLRSAERRWSGDGSILRVCRSDLVTGGST